MSFWNWLFGPRKLATHDFEGFAHMSSDEQRSFIVDKLAIARTHEEFVRCRDMMNKLVERSTPLDGGGVVPYQQRDRRDNRDNRNQQQNNNQNQNRR